MAWLARAWRSLMQRSFGFDVLACPRYGGRLRLIIQTPTVIVVMYEDLAYRQICLDGRALPSEPSPSFMGYQVGRWEGDTLVVDTHIFLLKASYWLNR